MMTVARKQQICVNQTPYYHIISRCVRQAFLFGKDPLTGDSYEHRRQWLVDRIKKTASVFAIDVCSYAIMSNHFHLVLRIGDNAQWTDKQVLMAWLFLYSLPILCQRYLQDDVSDELELKEVKQYVELYRERLCSISWFMKTVNEYIARKANQEDECTGHFWESRFKSQALLDERALLTCMAYVDLNPIRAGLAKSLRHSEFTSIKERIEHKSTDLLGFGQGDHDLPFYLSSYLDLLDQTGRIIRDDNHGFISVEMASVLSDLHLNPDTWLDELKAFKSFGFSAVGTVKQLQEYSAITKKKWSVGLRLEPA
ncbi:transposase [Marinicella gelatinilytica]|uniref:transposase n=1 Tax=Marinicella gelatinilytica TaxID=2996017 RepID=UPI0022608D2F|nr:transposase [Marinicella gelatinilytica]MCX7543903.1 transposase [Marinicella gelatinilytica]